MKVLAGPWSTNTIEHYLRDTVVPIRLASMDKGGCPVVLSLWYLYEDGVIWCATQRTAQVVKRLERAPRCGFEIAADRIPYRGIRGRADVTIDPGSGATILARLIERYLGGTESRLATRLLARAESEVALRLDALRVSTWDFTERMAE
jgi:hypothetical protein